MPLGGHFERSPELRRFAKGGMLADVKVEFRAGNTDDRDRPPIELNCSSQNLI
jgi:hypothetical protein